MVAQDLDEDEEAPLPHPLDLPPLSTKPSYSKLISLLTRLTPPPPPWTSPASPVRTTHNYAPWLTRLISTPMPWLPPAEAETITTVASHNLAILAGRTAAPDMLRTFSVEGHDIELFEPSWTGDSIGYKTWAASLLLARRLPSLHTVSTSQFLDPCKSGKCLGLGEGTGLLGIAAVKVMRWNVTLTDLPSITPNLRKNMEGNCSERADVKELDWRKPPSEEIIAQSGFDVVMGSDLFYDSEHPGMVVAMVERYLRRASEARAVIGYPLRTSHGREIEDFEEKMERAFDLEARGEDIGVEDWGAEVVCRWNIYKWKVDL